MAGNEALGVAGSDRRARFVSNQVYLSLLERSAEYDIVPTALDQRLGLLIWSPLAGGLLSGKFRRGRPSPKIAVTPAGGLSPGRGP